MPSRRIALASLLALVLTGGRVDAAETGGDNTPANAGGAAQISTWVVGAINGGVAPPAGTSSCTPTLQLSFALSC